MTTREEYLKNYKSTKDSALGRVFIFAILIIMSLMWLYFYNIIDLIVFFVGSFFLIVILYSFMKRKCPTCRKTMTNLISYKPGSANLFVCHKCKLKIELITNISDTG